MCEIGGKEKSPNSYSRDSDLTKNIVRSHFGPEIFELSARMVSNSPRKHAILRKSPIIRRTVKNYHSESELSASRVLEKRRSSS